jgi:hypothetical protein
MGDLENEATPEAIASRAWAPTVKGGLVWHQASGLTSTSGTLLLIRTVEG